MSKTSNNSKLTDSNSDLPGKQAPEEIIIQNNNLTHSNSHLQFDNFKDARIEELVNKLPKTHFFVVGGSLRNYVLDSINNPAQVLAPTSLVVSLEETLSTREVDGSIKNTDIDLACNLPIEELKNSLTQAGIKFIHTGISHDTLTVIPLEGQPAIEVTSFRGANQQLLSVEENLIEDLKLRDFTINALALCPHTKKFYDPCAGVSDLCHKIIRAVDNPTKRFQEDPLRVLRMIRIACQLGFEIEEETLLASKKFVRELQAISIERTREEFSKILVSPNSSKGLRLLAELGFLEIILKEFLDCQGFEQNRFHRLDVFEHTLEVINNCEPDLTLRLAALLHDIGKPPTLSVDEKGDRHFFLHEVEGAKMTEQILKRLKYPNQQAKHVTNLVQLHMRPLEAGPGGIRRLFRDIGDQYPLWRKLKEADEKACKMTSEEVHKRLADFDNKVAQILKGPDVSPLKALALNGNDLQNLGFRSGPQLGKILQALHEKVLENPELNDKEILLSMAKEYL